MKDVFLAVHSQDAILHNTLPITSSGLASILCLTKGDKETAG